jgi:hypothetical protein
MVRRPLASQIFVVDGLLKCIRPVCGAKLLAIMESARRWSIKCVELRRVLIPTQA